MQQLTLTVFPRDIEKQLSHSHSDIALRSNSRVVKNWPGFRVGRSCFGWTGGRLDSFFPARRLSLPVQNVSRHIKRAIEAEIAWLCKHEKFKPSESNEFSVADEMSQKKVCVKHSKVQNKHDYCNKRDKVQKNCSAGLCITNKQTITSRKSICLAFCLDQPAKLTGISFAMLCCRLFSFSWRVHRQAWN